MTTLASTLIGKAKTLAQDPGVRTADSEWLGWLSEGVREICIIRPSAYTITTSQPLVAGSKQSIPVDGVRFLDYVRSMGVSGSSPGAAARRVMRRRLDASNPSWHAAAPSAVPQHFMFDEDAPTEFYVYPPSDGTTQAEVRYSATPADIASLGATIPIADIYAGPLIDYLMYRAYQKDTEFAGNAERALLHRKAFETTMGLKAISDAEASKE